MIAIPWTGTFQPAQIWYTGTNCTGTAYLNDGGDGTPPFPKIFGKWVVFSGSANSLMAPTTVSGGTSTAETFTAQSIDNPTCGNNAAFTREGWKLSAVSRATVGLPATIAVPLRLQ